MAATTWPTMTAHTTTPSRSRRRRRGATHASSGRRRGTGRVWAGLVALTVLGAAGFAAAQWAPPGDGEARTEAGQKTAPDRKATPPPTPTPTTDARSTQRAKPAPAPSRSTTTTPTIPATGPGTFVTASGGSPKVGNGRTLRYRVEVETGLDLSTADVAEQVDRVLADPGAGRRTAPPRSSGSRRGPRTSSSRSRPRAPSTRSARRRAWTPGVSTTAA